MGHLGATEELNSLLIVSNAILILTNFEIQNAVVTNVHTRVYMSKIKIPEITIIKLFKNAIKL